jgi:hypothetical protein
MVKLVAMGGQRPHRRRACGALLAAYAAAALSSAASLAAPQQAPVARSLPFALEADGSGAVDGSFLSQPFQLRADATVSCRAGGVWPKLGPAFSPRVSTLEGAQTAWGHLRPGGYQLVFVTGSADGRTVPCTVSSGWSTPEGAQSPEPLPASPAPRRVACPPPTTCMPAIR